MNEHRPDSNTNSRDADAEWRPTRTSTRIVTGVTLGVVGLLLAAVPEIVGSTIVGFVGAGCLLASLRLVSTRGQKSRAASLAGALTVPAAAGLLGSAVVTTLLLTSRIFPVSSGRFVSVSMLVVAGNVGVMVGCVLAVLGVALGATSLADEETLEEFVSVTMLTGVAPAALTALLVLVAFLTGGGGGRSVPDLPLSVLLSPEGAGLHLADFLLLLGVTAGLLAGALKLLPAGELLADTGSGEVTDRRVIKAYYGLLGGGAVATFLGLVAVPVELVFAPEELRSLLSGSVYGTLRTVSTAWPLRLLLVAAAALAAVGLVGGAVLRTLARDGRWSPGPFVESPLPDRTGPATAGVLVTVLAVAVADPAYAAIVDGVAAQLPGVLATELRTRATDAAAVYGEATFTVLLVTALIAAVVGFAQILRAAIGLGYLSAETAGYSLASVGLFVGTVFAATLDVSTPLVFGGIVASLLVWDTGRFGTVMGREVGRDAGTERTELVHAGATVLVGLAGAVLAAVAASQLREGLAPDSSLAVVALLAVVFGVIAFAAALR